MLNQTLPTEATTTALQRIETTYLPTDLQGIVSTEILADTLRKRYPEAYGEYEQWRANPASYLDVQPERKPTVDIGCIAQVMGSNQHILKDFP